MLRTTCAMATMESVVAATKDFYISGVIQTNFTTRRSGKNQRDG